MLNSPKRTTAWSNMDRQVPRLPTQRCAQRVSYIVEYLVRTPTPRCFSQVLAIHISERRLQHNNATPGIALMLFPRACPLREFEQPLTQALWILRNRNGPCSYGSCGIVNFDYDCGINHFSPSFIDSYFSL
jgi:hypothetical protein